MYSIKIQYLKTEENGVTDRKGNRPLVVPTETCLFLGDNLLYRKIRVKKGEWDKVFMNLMGSDGVSPHYGPSDPPHVNKDQEVEFIYLTYDDEHGDRQYAHITESNMYVMENGNTIDVIHVPSFKFDQLYQDSK